MATSEATENYFKRLAHKNIPANSIRTFGKTGIAVSSIGFGGYRIHRDSIENAKALRYALLNGFNLIDTSSNYTDGGSEMLIGNLLQEMFDRQELSRDEVVVVSKVGYVQGQNMQLAQKNEANGRPFPEMVKYMEGCWHCIHPEFLQDQLSRSLDRLQLTHLDAYLLHNPEYFLSHARKNNTDQQTAQAEYYRRVKVAFEWMEEKVAEGKIKAYGISSNTFPLPAADFEFTSLEKTIELANDVAADNTFQVIQFPFNLFETGACLEKNQASGSKTLLQIAQENKIATLVNRPLNAMNDGGMLRLASFRETKTEIIEREFGERKKFISELEKRFKKEFLAKIPDELPKENFERVFSVSEQLSNALNAFQNWQHWDQVKQNNVVPQIFSYLHFLNEKWLDNSKWKQWSESYVRDLGDFLDTITKQYENQAQERSKEISGELDKLAPDLKTTETLSQKNLQVLTSVPGINCVLLGMRRTRYVEDAFAALTQPAISHAEKLLSDFDKKSS